MNENLTPQIVTALLQDGTVKMTGEEIAAAIADAIGALDKPYRFRGVATPDLAPGKIFEPTLYVAVADATYGPFSNQSVDKGQIVFFTSDDGAYWEATVAYDAGGGEDGCTETEMPETGFLPDTLYELGTIDEDTTFLMDTEAETDCGPNHYYWVFDTEGVQTAPTITWPDAITAWKDGAAPEIAADARYEISVLDGCAIVSKFDLATE